MSSKLSAPTITAECIQQEAALVLERLTAEDAMSIGLSTLKLAKTLARGRPVEIHNVNRKFNKSSWAVRLEYLERNADFQTETGLDPELFRAEGGAVPLNVCGSGRIGTMIVSGLAGWEDHVLTVRGLEKFLGRA